MKKLITGLGLIGAGYCIGWLRGVCYLGYTHGAAMVENCTDSENYKSLLDAEKRFYENVEKLEPVFKGLVK